MLNTVVLWLKDALARMGKGFEMANTVGEWPNVKEHK